MSNAPSTIKPMEVGSQHSQLYTLQVDNIGSGLGIEQFHVLIEDSVPIDANEQYLIPIEQLKNNYEQIQTQVSIEPVEEVQPSDYSINEHLSLEYHTAPPTALSKTSESKSLSKELINTTKSVRKINKTNKRKFKNVVRDHQIEEKIKFDTASYKIENYVHISDRPALPRAVSVLPTALQYRRHYISPRRSLPARVRFGPVQGVVQKIFPAEANELVEEAAAIHRPIFLFRRDNESVCHVNVTDKEKSNWIGLLPLGDQMSANVWLFEEDNELYCITTKHIATRTPLILGYSHTYAQQHSLPPGQPILDLQEALPLGQKQWWCTECSRNLGTYTDFLKHNKIIHADGKPLRQRKYKCSQCTRTFCTRYSLKRHKRRFCTGKSQNTYNSRSEDAVEEKCDMRSCSTPNIEDNRVPSDESLQNYTNGLDFSTNLFDTDRINLDMSVSSRSDPEYNPFVGGYKENNCLVQKDTMFLNGSVKGNSVVKESKIAKKSDETILISCRHCNQLIVKNKNRQHLRKCDGRRLQCCGKAYVNKLRLVEHIHTEHSINPKSLKSEHSNENQPNAEPYKCEDCPLSFKRRGMYMNHLWRVHHRTASVPLERRIHHYPCTACPNMYRTAAKRDCHMRRNHPGLELHRAAPIEGERLACQPAECPACPRQYSTRAKLLQHLRKTHPNQAVPLKKVSCQLKSSVKKKQATKSASTTHQS